MSSLSEPPLFDSPALPRHSRFYFEYAFKMIPHPNKVHKGGEDACYAHDNLMAVADGVSGWAEFGIDASLYARRLIDLIGEIFEEDSHFYVDNPLNLLEKAVSLNMEQGSSTICVLTLNPKTGVLKSVHLGDSIYGVYRGSPYSLQYEVQEQQKEFNLPYQLGIECDSPQLSIKHETQLQQNDIVLLGSDGLWDNMYPHSIEKLINERGGDIIKLVEQLTDTAYLNSLDDNFASPFYHKARSVGVDYPQRGKDDDVTILGAKICVLDK